MVPFASLIVSVASEYVEWTHSLCKLEMAVCVESTGNVGWPPSWPAVPCHRLGISFLHLYIYD